MEDSNKKDDISISINYAGHIEDSGMWISLKVKNYLGKQDKEVKVLLSNITYKSLRKIILDNGGLCTDGKSEYNTLLKEYNKGIKNGLIPIKWLHQDLGWQKFEGKQVFYYNNAISEDNSVESEYVGNVDVKSEKGVIDEVSKMIKQCIEQTEDWSPLEAVIAFCVGAIVLPYANKCWFKRLDNPMLHLVGDSTNGKTTALELFTGLGSSPEKNGKGFRLIHGSTSKSIIKRLEGVQGIPVSIDEMKKAKKGTYDDLIYTIGNGISPERLIAGGQRIQTSKPFASVVMSSGEGSLLSLCGSTTGLSVRCFEFFNVQWTESKAQALAISECIAKNYGLVPPLIAKELLKNGKQWQNRWDEISNEVQKKIETDRLGGSIVERITSFVVLFILSAEIANHVLGINLDIKEISKFCYDYLIIATSDNTNLGYRAYDYLMNHLFEHPEAYINDEFGGRGLWNDYYLEPGQIGIIREAGKKHLIGDVVYDKVIIFKRNYFENLLREGNFEPKVATRKLNEAKYLNSKDKSHPLYRDKISINNVSCECYLLYFKNDEFGEAIDD